MQTIVDYICNLKDLEQINEILEKFYSNFTVKDKSVSVIEFNPEWYGVLNPAWLSVVAQFRTLIINYSAVR
jgi:hypothetical protein